MAVYKSTVQSLSYNSSTPTRLNWSSLATGANNFYVDVNNADGSKLIILVARDSTIAGTTYYVGTSDTATSGTSYTFEFTGNKLGRMKLKTSKAAKAKAYTRFRSTASTKVVTIEVLGPFETARFKDADGYINVCKAKTGSTWSKVATILLP